MRFAGTVEKDGRYWLAEVPMLDLMTQGRNRKEALAMVQDAIETLVNVEGFRVDVFPGKGGDFEVGTGDVKRLVALMLRRQRERRGLSLAEMAKRLGASSRNAYARYEQGRSVPTVEKLHELLAAIEPQTDFVIRKSAA